MVFYAHRRILSRTVLSAALAASFGAFWCESATHAEDGTSAGSVPLIQASAVGETDQVASPDCDLACDEYLAQCGCSDSWWDGGETDLRRRLKSSGSR